MKNAACLTFGLVLCALGLTNLAPAQTLDSALAYFPMSIGNLWEYSLYMYGAGTFEGYYTFSVVGDTLMPNGIVYRKCNGGIDYLLIPPVYLRIDSATANVWLYNPSRGTETLWDSLRARPGDRGEWGSVRFSVDNVLGVATPTRTRYVGYQLLYEMAYDIGPMYSNFTDLDEYPIISRLVYAKINGKEYGTFLSLPPMVPNSPAEISLSQNYPNPFNPSTTIQYALPHRSRVILAVYNTLGQRVATLEDGTEEAGYHTVRFDGTGRATGVYVYRLQAGEFVLSRKLVLIR